MTAEQGRDDGLSAFIEAMSADWRRKTGYAPRYGEDMQPHEISAADRRFEFTEAQSEMRYVLATIDRKADPAIVWAAAEVVTRNRPVDARRLADAMSGERGRAPSRMNAALAASIMLGRAR